ncbi:hypothetical protein BDZ91DRAFT_728933 [Kalaharituber pfeilii]|nr:hypothetical protein BDZ91DRAFT_728933 [Kalaharituber pfeilii]
MATITEKRKASDDPDGDGTTSRQMSRRLKADTSAAPLPRTRIHNFFAVIREEVSWDEKDREEIEKTIHCGTFYKLADANRAAYKDGGSRGWEQYKKRFDNGMLTVSAVGVGIARGFYMTRAKVTKVPVELPEVFTVIKREVVLSETSVAPGSVHLVASALDAAEAENLVCAEIDAMKNREREWVRRMHREMEKDVAASEASAVGTTTGKVFEPEFKIVQRHGDGRRVMSRGAVEYSDLRAGFEFVWAEGVPLEASKSAEVDETEWSDDQDGNW